jgi:hypothetical protein
MVAIKSLALIFTYLIGLCGIIPLAPWLITFPRAVLIAGLFLGLWQDRKGIWLLRPWMQNVLIVPAFLYYALQFSRANPIQPVVSVLAMMLAVRLSGEKTVRHSLQIYALSIFCLASSSLFDLSPIFLLYLGLLLFMVALALVLLTFQNQDNAMAVSKPDLKRILIFGLLMPLLAVPLLLLFFPLMPRTQLPLWRFLAPPVTRTTGYADSVEPGSQNSIAETRTLAFRAEMPRQAQSRLYWRGTVFNRTDGLKWTRAGRIPAERLDLTGRPVAQIIYPEPSTAHTLIALDRPVALAQQRIKRSPDGVFELIGSAGKRLSYTADSLTGGLVAQRNAIDRQFYLQLPEQLPLRVKQLATEIVRAGKDDRDRVTFLEGYFRNGGYRYATRGLATGDKALEQFLFDKKQGHCEFFASSFALLLRAAGVPCRLVGGYLGGEYSELGSYYLVTDDKAHVWVEVYIKGSGWERIDPSSFAVNAGEIWSASGSRSLLLRISMVLDSFNHEWNRSVIAYDFEQQINVARHVGSRLERIEPVKKLRDSLPYLAICLLLAGALLAVRRSTLFCTREERILRRFLIKMAHGGGKPATTGGPGLLELAAASDNAQVAEFVSIYAGAVYHDRSLTDGEYARLRQLLKILKPVEVKIS